MDNILCQFASKEFDKKKTNKKLVKDSQFNFNDLPKLCHIPLQPIPKRCYPVGSHQFLLICIRLNLSWSYFHPLLLFSGNIYRIKVNQV
jgi:hypothetical protein